MAVELSDSHPDSAMAILDGISEEEQHFSKGLKMRYRLCRLNVENKLEKKFTSTKEVSELVTYFKHHGNRKEQILSIYLLGRAYNDLNEVPMALRYYKEAVEQTDTTDADCDFNQLSIICGQISNLFYKQNLMKENVRYAEMASRYAWMCNDTLSALLNKTNKILAMLRLGNNDSALILNDNLCHELKKYKYDKVAAGILTLSIEPLLEQKNYDKAKHYIDIYERESGFFDSLGNIKKGKELFYRTKAEYYRAVGKLDSAEYLLRKALREGKNYNIQNASAWSLSQVYISRQMPDSAAKYALYSYEMNDSLHRSRSTDEVTRMESAYNYNHYLETAQKERQRADDANRKLMLFIIATGIIAAYFYSYIKKTAKRREEARREYQKKVDETAHLQADLFTLRSQEQVFRSIIEEKEQMIGKLKDEVIEYSKKEKRKNHVERAKEIKRSDIYNEVKHRASIGKPLTEENKKDLYKLIITFFPNMYYYLSSRKPMLSDKEFLTCGLCILDCRTSEIGSLLNVSPPYISKIRKELTMRLFNEEDAKTLEERLLGMD